MTGATSPARSALIDVLAQYWRQWRRARSNVFDLPDCSIEEMARIATYLGMTPGALQCIATHSPGWADLLLRRLTALGLAPSELARADPATFGELARLCGSCESRGRCALDLTDEFADPGWQDWKDYCPNATTIRFLSAMYGFVDGADHGGSPSDAQPSRERTSEAGY
jgi:hypothetical protein